MATVTAATDEGKETPRKCRPENARVKMNLRPGPPTISAYAKKKGGWNSFRRPVYSAAPLIRRCSDDDQATFFRGGLNA